MYMVLWSPQHPTLLAPQLLAAAAACLPPAPPAQPPCTAQSWPGHCSRHAAPAQPQLPASPAACTAASHGELHRMPQHQGLPEQPASKQCSSRLRGVERQVRHLVLATPLLLLLLPVLLAQLLLVPVVRKLRLQYDTER